MASGTRDVLAPGSGVDYCRADLCYLEGPRSVTIEGGWVIGPAYPFSMSAIFQFEEATMGFGIESGGTLAVYRKDGRKEIPPLPDETGYAFELAYFLECLSAERPVDRCPPEESRDAIAMALEARDAIEAGPGRS
jgi:hypothetical protein